MNAIYLDSSIPENQAKQRYTFPEFIMMENAAAALENKILSLPDFNSNKQILILCGCGNNGGDGYALARRLFGKCKVSVIKTGQATSSEAIVQAQISKKMGINFLSMAYVSQLDFSNYFAIVDSIYGSGFHGTFSPEIEKLLIKINKEKAIKIACDIPSGIEKNGRAQKNSFKADFTVTMGALKIALFSDQAKELCGQITVADLGISSTIFNSLAPAQAYLIEEKDIKLPFRKNKNSHKGSYGHSLIFAGEKAGAAILSATAAMNFGSGLTSLLQTANSNLNQFKISPSLMISSEIPEKTTSVIIGNGLGLGKEAEKSITTFIKWMKQSKNPNCVIDADLFSYTKLKALLGELNSLEKANIILTPHPKELQNLVNQLSINGKNDYSLEEVIENKLDLGKEILKIYPKLTLILKGANTLILCEEQVFICHIGSPSLAKGGSGDILAGLCGGLLAQGYSAKDAAITAVYSQARAANKISPEDFSLTPEKLLDYLLN
ncbi:MAG: NAD(P)H-hydrate dehydratase [Treponema sp.]|nr:NAD(P)H-hydrate dehydratase [Treponema sp.]